MDRIEKRDGPSPGSYEVQDALNKTQWITRKPVMDKSPQASFIDKYIKKHKFVPGVGSYKETENAFLKLGKSDMFKSKRH